jgi:hypothetical protein
VYLQHSVQRFCERREANEELGGIRLFSLVLSEAELLIDEGNFSFLSQVAEPIEIPLRPNAVSRFPA